MEMEIKGGDQICQSRNLIKKQNEGSVSINSMESSESESEDVSSSYMSLPFSSHEPLFHLSELMNQLPVKKGLSKHYQGKSQSFTSLANVSNLEELGKKVSPFISSYRRMKSCKSYAAGFDDGHNFNNKFGPKATITKKSSRGTSFFLSSTIASLQEELLFSCLLQ